GYCFHILEIYFLVVFGIHFLLRSSRRATASSSRRKPASIFSRTSFISWWNSAFVTYSGSWAGLVRNSFLASRAIEAMAAAERSQFSMAPLGGAAIWERRNIAGSEQGL